MIKENWVRTTLWISFPFNLIAAWVLLMPQSPLGQLLELPRDVPLGYAALLSWIIGLFGLVYAWLASCTRINRGMLGASAIAKAGVFFILFGLWLMEEASIRMLILTSGDLAFAIIWGGWLLGQASHSPAPNPESPAR